MCCISMKIKVFYNLDWFSVADLHPYSITAAQAGKIEGKEKT